MGRFLVVTGRFLLILPERGAWQVFIARLL